MANRFVAISALLVGLTSSVPASAAEPSEFITHLMGRVPGQGKTFACFSHVYDDAHLGAHPQQNVRSMRVLIVAYSALQYAYQLRMGFEFRGRPETLTTVAECGPSVSEANSARGSAVCAGPVGGRSMSLSLEGEHSVLMTLPDGAHLWKPGPPRPNDTVNDAFGPNDKLFRLDRTALPLCDDQAIGAEEKAFLDESR